MSGAELLSDEQYANYLRDGYLEVTPASLGPADHDFFYGRAADLYELARLTRSPTAHLDILGDNLRAQIPEIDRLLGDPVVDGALTRLLGPDYLTHPHSFCHRSSDRDQIFHQDGNLPWNERGHARAHRGDWVMLFYYPQDVDETNGPTEVVAGSQYWTIDHETDDGGWHPGDRIDRSVDEEIFSGDDLALRDQTQTAALERGLGVPDLDRRFLHVAGGTVLLAHYDLFHRGSRTEGHPEARYLYKFYFARTKEPTAPTLPSLSLPNVSDLSDVRPDLRPVVAANWQWAAGDVPIGPSEPGANRVGVGDRVGVGSGVGGDEPDTATLAARMMVGSESDRVEAAYLLGQRARHGEGDALQTLQQGLWADVEAARRSAGHGLRQAGSIGIDALLHGLGHGPPPTRRPAVAALGTVVAAARPEAVAAVAAIVASDPDDLVRSNAAYSLGQMARRPDGLDIDLIAAALLAALAPGVEPDNAFNVGLSRSTVRQSAAFGLALIMANHVLADAHVEQIIVGPLQDSDRYVQGLIAAGLVKAELSTEAQRRVMVYLSGRRWNRSPAPPVTG